MVLSSKLRKRKGISSTQRGNFFKSPIASSPKVTLAKVEEKPVEPVIETPEEPQPEPVAQQLTSTGSVEDIIRQAARNHGVDENHLLRIAECESTLNPNAVNTAYYENGHPSGLFQHLSGYFPARAEKYGYSTDVFDAQSNANVTAAMFAEGLSYLWECH